MPLKLDLTEKLIEAENVEAMQNVLDLSIGLIGEEKSLYDLALSFLCLGTLRQGYGSRSAFFREAGSGST